ncbi:hypothetical protein [Polynucleobacter necessarius]|uniref:hypothetical protein n=1 Tax=Polynucleobacter necessarius TaxID=576610 RepID=UPI000E08E876|nr:hypothetical protein [Polynucleobacter necessarius]HAT39068.1 hypothetical protein [Polynucleobacter sp.]
MQERVLRNIDTTLTVMLGIVAMLLPLVVGRLFWKRFDPYFIKKIDLTVLVAFIILWIGMSLVFTGNAA